MGKYAGVLLGISFCLAWAAIFVPKLAGNRRLMMNMAIVSLPGVVWSLATGFFPYMLALVILIVYEVIAFSHHSRMKALPALSVLFLFLTVWAPLDLHKIAQWMWAKPETGIVNSGSASIELALIDLLAMFLAIFLSVLLWVALAKRRAPGILALSSICSLASTVLSGVACYYAGPRGGDIGEGLMVMFILIPGAFVTAAITLATCIIVLTVSLARTARLPASVKRETNPCS